MICLDTPCLWEGVWVIGCMAFIGTHPLIHTHVEMSVGKWIMEITCPHKHVHIAEDQIFLSCIVQHDCFLLILYLKLWSFQIMINQ